MVNKSASIPASSAAYLVKQDYFTKSLD